MQFPSQSVSPARRAWKTLTLLWLALALVLASSSEPSWAASTCRAVNRSPDTLEKLSDYYILSPKARQSLEATPKAVASWEARRANGKPVLALAVSSFNLAMGEVATIENYLHYEHRALWNILRARHPNVRVLFVSSEKIPEVAIQHMLQGLSPQEAKLVRSRVDFLHLGDKRHIYLTDKILENPEALNQILSRGNALLGEKVDPTNTLLFPYNVTAEVASLSKTLNVRYIGLNPVLRYLNDKSGNHELFETTKVPHPKSFIHLYKESDIVEAIHKLFTEDPALQMIFTKTNQGTSGQGIFNLSRQELIDEGYGSQIHPGLAKRIIRRVLRAKVHMGETWTQVMERNRTDGAIVQEGIPHTNSPSVQIYIHASGQVEILSTHMQIIKDMAYYGSRYPAYPGRRHLQAQLSQYAMELGRALSHHGVRGRAAFDFFEVQANGKKDFVVGEVNIREGGTTHAWEILQRQLDAYQDPVTGVMKNTATGLPIYYVMTDAFEAPWLKGFSAEQFLKRLQKSPHWPQLKYRRHSGQGIQFHMLKGIGEFGKVAYTASATTPEKAQQLFEQMESLLNALHQP